MFQVSTVTYIVSHIASFQIILKSTNNFYLQPPKEPIPTDLIFYFNSLLKLKI